MVTGPMSITQVTLSKNAESSPESAASTQKIAIAFPRATAATRTATHWKKPVRERTWTLIIMAKRRTSVPQSTWCMISCSSGFSCTSMCRPRPRHTPHSAAYTRLITSDRMSPNVSRKSTPARITRAWPMGPISMSCSIMPTGALRSVVIRKKRGSSLPTSCEAGSMHVCRYSVSVCSRRRIVSFRNRRAPGVSGPVPPAQNSQTRLADAPSSASRRLCPKTGRPFSPDTAWSRRCPPP
mmetsp:Transcript_6567/g.21544  ORF Transcript_6567/g.21544 Transcript_6567/m.21544 type:complete len:239 (-) Transcript_6567:1057-1773(-)